MKRRSRRRLSRAGLLLSLGMLAGCQTWHTVPARPGVPAFQGRATEARITFPDGSVTRLSGAVVAADTVLGTSPETGLIRRTPNDAIQTLEIRRVSKTRTVGLLVVHASFIVSVIALVVHIQPHYRGAF